MGIFIQQYRNPDGTIDIANGVGSGQGVALGQMNAAIGAAISPLISSLSTYSNPSWITTLAWSKITGIPTTLAGYGITDAYPLSGNPSAFLTSIPNSYSGWIKITKSFSDFSTAALTNTITITTLPVKSVVSAVVMNPSTAFLGGLIAGYTISVGMASTVDLMPASSTFTTSARPFASNLIGAGTVGSTQAITATAVSITGLLNTASQGSVDIWLLVSTLP